MPIAFDAFSYKGGAFGFQFQGDTSWTHTPVGTPKGVLVSVVTDNTLTDNVIGITYGGVSLTEISGSPFAVDISEDSVTHIFFLGSSVPTGAVTVAVDLNEDALYNSAYCYTLTASGDTEVNNSVTLSNASLANPSTTLTLGSISSFVAEVFYSGQSAPGGVTPLSGWTSRFEQDYGSAVGGSYSYDTVDTADVTVGYTATADDVALVGIAIKEAASGGATHASSGDLTADSAVVAGSSTHIALHPSSGALTAQSATTAGTALHSIPHASSGALDAQSATVAGTSAHITMHPSSGALSAQDAVIDGTADHTVPGVVTHYSSGALTAQDAVIAGTATHIVNHQSSGALASGDATVSGASIHNLTHATSGDLIAENATISGSYQGGTAVVSQASGGSSSQGRQSRNRKQRLILIDTIEEVEDLLDQVDEVIKEEPKKKKINWKKAKPAPDFGTEPQDVINRLDFYTAQLDQLRDQNRAKELKQQLEQNAAIYRQLLVKRASDAMILANNAKIREEEDIMLLLMAA